MSRNRQQAKALAVHGIVQGVGFRPFVYGLARRFGLRGEVSNTGDGVQIYVEGEGPDIADFCQALAETPPPLARITRIRERHARVRGLDRFTIVPSQEGAVSTLISPDVCVCQACLAELFDPKDRRYRYPFINCTNCGPRYTIIEGIPYDRPKTSMKGFAMCPDCAAEYHDPGDRRFHAQPNACPVCGPQVLLRDGQGEQVKCADPIARAGELLRSGHILAVKGLGGFHLAADAKHPEAVARLRQRKGREEKPFALMSPHMAAIRGYARVSEPERRLLDSPQRPIVLLEKKGAHGIAPQVAPNNRYFGVMLPYTPLHYLLIAGFVALVMTSANKSQEPIVIDNADGFSRLADIADFFLIHNRDIHQRCDDSIARHLAGANRILRRSRGYVPAPIFLKQDGPSVLACGGMLKNTVCLTRKDQAFLSQHIGDLDNYPAYQGFEGAIAHLKRILQIEPMIIAHDLHPDYPSTRYALNQDPLPCIGVQHHHAHILSCMAEHGIDGPVIGLAFDGTGYGTDGAIWGGEVLIAEETGFERKAHLRYTPMPGGEAAIQGPWRMGMSYLYQGFGADFVNMDIKLVKGRSEQEKTVLLKMLEKGLNTPLTSSLGRLFDGVAAILGIRETVSFEGQAAMELEMRADLSQSEIYPYSWSGHAPYIIETTPLIQGVVRDMQNRLSVAAISSRFHHSLSALFADLCARIAGETGLNRVVLSGGVFQNALLLTCLSQALTARGLRVFGHCQIPCNDGGICLGQAVAALARSPHP